MFGRMAKKIETIVTLTDAIDGGKADQTVSFAVRGQACEIDLSNKNARAFEKALAPYVGVARKVQGKRRRPSSAVAGARGTRSRADLHDVRAWANANGHAVSDRGRVPKTVQDAYDAAH